MILFLNNKYCHVFLFLFCWIKSYIFTHNSLHITLKTKAKENIGCKYLFRITRVNINYALFFYIEIRQIPFPKVDDSLAVSDDTEQPCPIGIRCVAPGHSLVVRVSAVIFLVTQCTLWVFMWGLTVPALTRVPKLRHIVSSKVELSLWVRVRDTFQWWSR